MLVSYRCMFADRGRNHFLTFEMYRSENDFYCGPSYIARYDERIRFNGLSNDRCEADREEMDVHNVVFLDRHSARYIK